MRIVVVYKKEVARHLRHGRIPKNKVKGKKQLKRLTKQINDKFLNVNYQNLFCSNLI